MKTKIYLILILSVFLASCSSLQQTAVNDDLYYSPTDEYVASNDIYENPTYDKNKSVSINSEYDKKISDIIEDDSKNDVDTTIIENEESESSYDRIMVDDYQEAYDRRLKAKQSPYYGMNNYYRVYFSSDYAFASMFFNDPYYNVVIIGDQVWVEPYYVSSSFYYWGRPSYYRSSWYYSSYYHSPYYSYYNYPYYNNPYYYNPYYNPYYSPYSTNYNYYGNTNENWAGSGYNSYRRRSLSTMSGSGVSDVNQRVARNTESYMGRDITQASSVKSGLDNTQEGRPARRSDVVTQRSGDNNLDARKTVRVVNDQDSRVVRDHNRQDPERRTSVSENRTQTRNYTRSQESSRSTYNANRKATRYSRPESTSNSGREVERSSSGTSTYTPNRSTRSNNSGTSKSYTPRRSSGSSGSSGSSSSSGTVRSSGSSGSSSSSGSSTRSSGSGRRR